MSTLQNIFRSLWASLLLLLVGCETTHSVGPEAGDTPPAGMAWIVFSVSQDKGPDTPIFGVSAGKNVEFKVTLRDAAGQQQTAAAPAVNALGNLLGDVHVREVPAGRVEFSSWSLTHYTGAATRGFTPRETPRPRSADVAAGTITYLGNVHATTEWGKNLFGIPLLAGGLPSWHDESARDLEVLYRTRPHFRNRVIVAPVAGGAWIPPL